MLNNETQDDLKFADSVRLAVRLARKPLITLTIYLVYWFYVNFFGVVAFFSGNMFLEPLMMLVFFIWGIVISLRIRSVKGTNTRQAIFVTGMIIAFVPFVLLQLGFVVNDAGIYVKLQRYQKQLAEGCELAMRNVPENFPESARKYKQFDIWSYGARPTRYYLEHKDGIVYLDFNGSPDDGSGVIYNPQNHKIKFHEEHYSHMFGPWYRFRVNYE